LQIRVSSAYEWFEWTFCFGKNYSKFKKIEIDWLIKLGFLDKF
jgi:hypothetical protein